MNGNVKSMATLKIKDKFKTYDVTEDGSSVCELISLEPGGAGFVSEELLLSSYSDRYVVTENVSVGGNYW